MIPKSMNLCLTRLGEAADGRVRGVTAKSLWRVEFDADGNHVSCAKVPDGGADDERVHYVLAHSELEAYRAAERQRVLVAQRNRARERIAAGKCPRCGIGEYDGSTRCLTCKHRDACHSAKRRLDAANDRFGPTLSGLPPGPPRKERSAPLTREQQLRLGFLQEVSRQWEDSPNIGAFGRWLASEILALDPAARERRSA